MTDFSKLPVDFENWWLFAYANAVCQPLNLKLRKLKGRSHEPRREVHETDPFEKLLPGKYVHPPKKGALGRGHKRLKNRSELFGTVRVALEDHYTILFDALLACGYDLERSKVICLKAYGAAKVFWEMNREPMPEEMASRLRNLSRKLIRREDAELFRSLQS
jgi:hypothetical protein